MWKAVMVSMTSWIAWVLFAGWTGCVAEGASAVSTYSLGAGNSQQLHIEQEFSEAEEGSVIWDSSRCLLAHVQRSTEPRGQRVIEIGSGTGFVGIALARLGAKSVVLTDKHSQLPLLRRNIEHNRRPPQVGECDWITSVEVAPLCWGGGWSDEAPHLSAPASFDWIICCDCVYPGVSSEPLVVTLLELLETNPEATVLLACEYRPPPAALSEGVDHVQYFFERMRHECHMEQVPDDEQDPQWRCDEVTLWRMKHRTKRAL